VDLVADIDGQVVAALFARVIRPPESAGFAYPRDVSATRLSIEYLAALAEHRRSGAGTALVEAAEAWGREQGATVAETSTFHGSPLSVPFWTERAGYSQRSINLRKDL
jgi:GNAT superfamily N-acetyltransferase